MSVNKKKSEKNFNMDFLLILKNKWGNDYTNHYEDPCIEGYSGCKRYTNDFCSSEINLVERFGNRKVERYNPNFLDALRNLYGEKCLEYLEETNDEIEKLLTDTPGLTRYSPEHLKCRKNNNKNVKATRKNIRMNHIEAIKSIRDFFNQCNEQLLQLNSDSEICTTCFEVSEKNQKFCTHEKVLYFNILYN